MVPFTGFIVKQMELVLQQAKRQTAWVEFTAVQDLSLHSFQADSWGPTSLLSNGHGQ
jgi:hypothetical protein